MSHHNETVEVVFNKTVGGYAAGRVASLPVDIWLLSILRGGFVEILNPASRVFNKDAQSVEDIWVKEAPKVAALKPEPKKEESLAPKGKTDSFIQAVIAVQSSENEK